MKLNIENDHEYNYIRLLLLRDSQNLLLQKQAAMESKEIAASRALSSAELVRVERCIEINKKLIQELSPF